MPTTIGDSDFSKGGFFTETFNLDLGTSGSGLSLAFDDFTSTRVLGSFVTLALYNSAFTKVAAATWSASGLHPLWGSFSGLVAGASTTDYRLTVLATHAFGPKNTATWGGTVAVVPEPGTYALLLAGLGVVGFVARRRRPND